MEILRDAPYIEEAEIYGKRDEPIHCDGCSRWLNDPYETVEYITSGGLHYCKDCFETSLSKISDSLIEVLSEVPEIYDADSMAEKIITFIFEQTFKEE